MKQGITKREREVTDINEIKEILDKSMIVHIGMIDGDEPYVVPMNYGYTLEDGELCIYLHGATVGRKLDIIKKNPKVFFEMECDVEPFEGKVACQYGTTYASVMGLGTAEILEKAEDKIDGLTKFMKTQTGKDFTFDEKMVSIVSVIKITAKDFTAKKRPKPMGIK
jgi:nitroimidazol reductase NimA-like FMN-containing flavoprotein (pyridoxamine 5'-phosphate oxidase superfamily)